MRLLYSLFLIVIIFSATIAQWKLVSGTYGTSVNCFFVKDKNIFAGTQAGAFLSTDNGVTWTGVNSGLYSPQIYAFASIQNTVFAGTMSANGASPSQILGAMQAKFPVPKK